LIPILSIEGAAISTLISYLIVMCVSIFKSRSLLRFETDISKLIKVFLIVILMVFLDLSLKIHDPDVHIFFRFTLSLLTISVLCLALNIFELNKLKKIIKKK
jgi:O-antigen/teichoic acid export membrane protein